MNQVQEQEIRPVLNCSNAKSCSFVSFRKNLNAFIHSTFMKCFEMKVKKEFSTSIRFIVLGFKKAFENVVRGSKGISMHFRYPGQLLTDLQADEFLWKNAYDKESFTMFKLASMRCSISVSYEELKKN